MLHKSSFAIGREDIRMPVEEDETVIFGFRSQSTQVSVGIDAIVERALHEGTNIIIEGVHLAPEIILNRYREHPNVCSMVVYLSDEEVHQGRFQVRALGTSMRRPAEEYISYFDEIRQIHDYIFDSALRGGINTVENLSIEASSDAGVEIVANRVYEMAAKASGAVQDSFLLLDASTRR
jgi:2-phosphoglycerate kinase